MRFGLLLVALLSPVPRPSGDQPDARTASELKHLAGVWAAEPPAADGVRTTFLFTGAEAGWLAAWQRSRLVDGDREKQIVNLRFYRVTLNPGAKPKQITLTRGEGDDKETRLGVYEVEGDTLRMAFGREKDRPEKLDDKAAQLLTLKRVKPKE